VKRGLLLLAFALVAAVARAQFQMPDPKQMSGIPRPVTDLPDHAVSVRLIRGDLSNNITNHAVELKIGSKSITVKTDESGRAQFNDVPGGVSVKAIADVDGEHLESQEFPGPSRGGIRLMLVATDKTKGPATEPDAPAISGAVVITDQSRIVLQPADESLQVFYLLDVDNSARVPVNPTTPFAFDLPAGTVGAGAMDGSSPLASVKGTKVAVAGPFPPGHTFIQIAGEIPTESGDVDVTQRFPANVQGLAVIVKKVGATTLVSPQIVNQREMPAEGETYIAGTGGAIAAGQPIALTIGGVPHQNRAPRFIALALSAAIVVLGLWLGGGTPSDDKTERAAERRRLLARKDKLLNEVVRLEHERRIGRVDEKRYAARRGELVASLEQVYGVLDGDDAAPDAGLAA